jgi:hypothetical protein
MDTFYPTKHWLLTLIIEPVVLTIYGYLFLGSKDIIADLSIQVIILIVSLILSLPAFGIYYAIFYLLKGKITDHFLLKVALNLVVIACILITFQVLGGKLMNIMTFSYSLSAIVSSIFLKIQKESTVVELELESKFSDKLNGT